MINIINLLSQKVVNTLGMIFLETKTLHHRLEPMDFFVRKYLEDRLIDNELIDYIQNSYEEFPSKTLLNSEKLFFVESFSELASFSKHIDLSLSNVLSPSSIFRTEDLTKVLTVDDLDILFVSLEPEEHLLFPYFLYILLVELNNVNDIIYSGLEVSQINKEDFSKFFRYTTQKINLLAKLL